MTDTAVRALNLASKLVDFVAMADVDGEGILVGDKTYSPDELRDEIQRGLASLKQGPRELNGVELYARLNAEIKRHGSISAAAREIGVAKQTLHHVLSAKRPCPPVILRRRLGLERVPPGRDLYRET